MFISRAIPLKIDLRRLILILALISLLLTLASSLFASFRVQKASLIEGTLEANHAYATKVASSVDDFLSSAQQQLEYSAHIISDRLHDTQFLISETKRLNKQTDSFNSVVIVDHTGLVLATDPDLGILGTQLTSEGSAQSIRERKPLISPPFVAQTGRLLITISHPIFDESKNYLGYISGTIYLQEPSILNHLIGRHFHRDGSYLYVVDASKRLIYHPQPERIGAVIEGNPVIDDIVSGNSGTMQLVNSQAIEMLAGYAPVPSAVWGIVSQRPLQATLEPLNDLVVRVLLNALPLTILIGLFIGWFARLVSRPLRRLAESASTMDRAEATQEIENTRAWYFETAQLKKALLAGIMLMHGRISRLHQDVETDPLTGLTNRRGYTTTLKNWESTQTSIAIITIDIDHFKLVNDTYGHDVGDVVLKHLAGVMRACSRREDVVCRTGGEEFVILVPYAEPEFVREMGERLRRTVQETPFEHVGHITVSLGVAIWPNDAGNIEELAKLSDKMLYKAKHNGRNRVEMAMDHL